MIGEAIKHITFQARMSCSYGQETLPPPTDYDCFNFSWIVLHNIFEVRIHQSHALETFISREKVLRLDPY